MRHMILTGTLMLALSTTCMASQIYKWVDKQGVTHFGAQPPQSQQATTINTSAAAPRATAREPAATAEEHDPKQAAIDKKVKKDVAKQEAEHKQYCENARTNLAQLENNPRLRIEEESGETRRIDENERQKRITELKKSITEKCK